MSARQSDLWRRHLTTLPRAHSAPLGTAAYKVVAEDFRVEERLGFTADGGRAHVLLEIEKRNLDTLEVARRVAHRAGVAVSEVGFAGHKDRRAVATQWFTVPARPGIEWQDVREGELAGNGFRVRSSAPHSRKLKRGALEGNRFKIRLRALGATVPAERLAQRLTQLGHEGFPNYFGPQRFGHDYQNLDRLERWLERGRTSGGREARAFVWSTARALLFNAVLAARVADGSWRQLLPGERVNLDATGSFFVAAEIDDTLASRAAALDVHPTGPLPGRGPVPDGEAGRREADILLPYAPIVAALIADRMTAARRPLRAHPIGLEGSSEGDTLTLDFGLPAGSYATALLAECVALEAAPGGGLVEPEE